MGIKGQYYHWKQNKICESNLNRFLNHRLLSNLTKQIKQKTKNKTNQTKGNENEANC